MNIILITGMFVFFRLPEVPPDTAETNPIMRHNEIHKFSQLSPDSIITGCAKMSLEFISRFDDLTESLGGNLPDISFKQQWLRDYCYYSKSSSILAPKILV